MQTTTGETEEYCCLKRLHTISTPMDAEKSHAVPTQNKYLYTRNLKNVHFDIFQ